MRLKTKLILGLGFLFLIILAIVAFSSYNIGKLAKDSKNILKDNYDSIVYAKNMFFALDDMSASVYSAMIGSKKKTQGGAYALYFENARMEFEINLKKQNGNITEINETEYVETLNQDYEVFVGLCGGILKEPVNKSAYIDEFRQAHSKLRQSVNIINDINMQAVVRKNQIVTKESSNFLIIMAVIGAVSILLAFGYFWYFPLYISTSISYLSGRMKELVKKAGVKTDFAAKDEALFILHSINLLENKFEVKEAGPKARPAGRRG